MRTLKLIEYVTLDGVMEDPGPTGGFQHRGWTLPYWNEEMLEAQSNELFASDTLLLGRVTYEEFVAAWPLRSGDAFTDKMNSMRKVVASRDASTQLKWNATLLRGDVVDSVRRLKMEAGDDILIYGSSTLAQTLMPHGLIDKYQFIVYPLALGKGRTFLKNGAHKVELNLVSAATTRMGVTLLTYMKE